MQSSFALFRIPCNSLELLNFFRNSNTDISFFKESLYLASKPLFLRFNEIHTLSEKERESVLLSVLKYWKRSCTRSTPFGTFAGTLFVNISDSPTKIILNNRISHKKIIRLDTFLLDQIIQKVTASLTQLDKVILFTNDTAYQVGGSLRFVEFTILNNLRNYRLASIRETSLIRNLINRAESGASICELSNILVKNEDISYNEAKDFVIELWKAQLFYSELDLKVTGQNPFDRFLDTLSRIDDQSMHETLGQLRYIQKLLNKPYFNLNQIKQLEVQIDKLPYDFSDVKDKFQVDVGLSAVHANLNKSEVDEIHSQVKELLALNRPYYITDFAYFKEQFNQKYDGELVPLSIVLDSDIGLGYGEREKTFVPNSFIIDSLNVRSSSYEDDGVKNDYVSKFISNKYLQFISKGGGKIMEIAESELSPLKGKARSGMFSNSMYIMGSIFKDEFKSGNFKFLLKLFNGPNAATLMGRFTGNNPSLYEKAKQLLAEEESEHQDSIYAEIVHLPQSRVGNVILRPILRKYEISYMGSSGASIENQIHLKDLYIKSINGEIVLFSIKLKKRIIPRLTTAHNFTANSLPVYKFLCDLQYQDKRCCTMWDWGPYQSLRFLPRVVYKNIILKKARWKIELKDFVDLKPDRSNLLSLTNKIKEEFDLPDNVIYCEEDSELELNLTHPDDLKMLVNFIQKQKTVHLFECILTPTNSLISDESGGFFANEVVIPMSMPSSPMNTPFKNEIFNASVQQTFLLNSEWLYMKVYCSLANTRSFLTEILLPFINQGAEEYSFEKFFFIRYNDPQPHIRIRFYNKDIEKQGHLRNEIINLLNYHVIHNHIVSIKIDTYKRELHRYSPNLIV